MIVLDASAVLALLLDEPGAAMVTPVTRESMLSVVNLCEILTKTADGGGDLPLTQAIIASWGVTIGTFDDAHAIEAARLRPLTVHLGLSLGDRACLAHGVIAKCPVMTADQRMAQANIGIEIQLIR